MQKKRFLASSRLSWTVFFILILLPIFFYFAYLSVYGVNVPFYDDWEIVSLMGHFYAGNLKFGRLWAQHNENRMFIPNLIFIALYRLTAFNVKAAMFAGGLFLTLSFACLTYIFLKRHSLSWKFVPLAYLFFSLSDPENILWGFQMAWQLVSFCFLGSMACLEESGNSQTAFAVAILFAVLASFSSLQGLFIWPAGLVYLAFNDFSLRQKKIWISSALLCGIIYFAGFNFHSTGGPPVTYGLIHPLALLKHLLILLGGTLVFPIQYAKEPFFIARGFAGLFILGAGALSTVAATMMSKKDKAFLAPAALGIFAFLFYISVAIGRAGFGPGQALSNRYSLYGIFLFVAIYLTLLETIKISGEKFLFLFRAFSVIVIFQITTSLHWGMSMGRNYFLHNLKSQEILINYKIVSPQLISIYLYPRPNEIPSRASILEKRHLSVFSNWRSRTLLPMPPALKNLCQKRPVNWLIWRLLSTIYFYRPDLQKKYPPIPSEKDFAREITSWAAHGAITDDPDRSLLLPWKDQILQINRALK